MIIVDTISLGKPASVLEKIEQLDVVQIIRNCAASHPPYGNLTEMPVQLIPGFTLEDPSVCCIYKVRPGFQC